MIPSGWRSRRMASVFLLLAACTKARHESGDAIVARAEMRDAWLAVVVPVAIALLLLLVLLISRQRRKPTAVLDGLFRPRQLSEVRRWWRARVAESARRRADRTAARAAARAEWATWEAQTAARTTPLVPVPLGPPTMRPHGLFFSALGMSILIACLYGFSRDVGDPNGWGPNGWGPLVVLMFGVPTLFACLIIATVIAISISVTPRRNVAIATGFGALSGWISCVFVPLLVELGIVGHIVILGAVTGLAVGLFDQGSRKPIASEAAPVESNAAAVTKADL